MEQMQRNANSEKNFSPEKWYFVDWLATPAINRQPNTQKKVAKHLGVNPVTLTRWKAEDSVQKAVNGLIWQRMADYMPSAMEAIHSHVLRGSAAHARLFLEYVTPLLDNKRGKEEEEVAHARTKVQEKHGTYRPDIPEMMGFNI